MQLRRRQFSEGIELSEAGYRRALLLIRADIEDRKGRIPSTKKPGRKPKEELTLESLFGDDFLEANKQTEESTKTEESKDS